MCGWKELKGFVSFRMRCVMLLLTLITKLVDRHEITHNSFKGSCCETEDSDEKQIRLARMVRMASGYRKRAGGQLYRLAPKGKQDGMQGLERRRVYCLWINRRVL